MTNLMQETAAPSTRAWRRLDAISILGLAVVVIAVCWPLLRAPVFAFDEGILLSYSDFWTRGLLPNRDFFTQYPPGNYWAIGTAFRLLGTSVASEREIGFLYRALLTLSVFSICRSRGRGIAFVAAAMSFLASTKDGLAAYAWVGALAMALASIASFSQALNTSGRRRTGWLLIAGCLAAFTALLRTDLPGIGIVVAVLPLMTRLSRREIALVIAAWLAGILPLAVHAVRCGFSTLLDNFYLAPLRIAPLRRLPIPPTDHYTAVAFFITMACVAIAVAGSLASFFPQRSAHVAASERRKNENRVFLSTAIFTLLCAPHALGRADIPHLMYVSMVALPFAAIGISQLLDAFVGGPTHQDRCAAWRQIVSTSLVAVLILVGERCVIPFANRRNDPFVHEATAVPDAPGIVSHDGRQLILFDDEFAEVTNYLMHLADLLTRPGDRVFVGPGDLRCAGMNDLDLYFILPRLNPAGYILQVDPGHSNAAGSALAAGAASANLLILNTAESSPDSTANGGIESDAANQIVANNFVLKATVGPYRVYVRK